eukprot:8982097-Prorocentrum_lima.AAC.1
MSRGWALLSGVADTPVGGFRIMASGGGRHYLRWPMLRCCAGCRIALLLLLSWTGKANLGGSLRGRFCAEASLTQRGFDRERRISRRWRILSGAFCQSMRACRG